MDSAGLLAMYSSREVGEGEVGIQNRNGIQNKEKILSSWQIICDVLVLLRT